MSYYRNFDVCCESEDCKDDCQCDTKHHGCVTCQSRCGCICDELYESWKDSQLD
jgi:hypothetical protein